MTIRPSGAGSVAGILPGPCVLPVSFAQVQLTCPSLRPEVERTDLRDLPPWPAGRAGDGAGA